MAIPAQAANLLINDIIGSKESNIGEVKYLVKNYYMIQGQRIRLGNQARASAESGEPASTISWLAGEMHGLESAIATVISDRIMAYPLGQWLVSIKGIGPVLAGGLMSNIDITKAKTAGSIWRYAGLDPTTTWNKGEVRPWNADLKTICYKIGESFIKVGGHKNPPIYSVIYKERKREEWIKNLSGAFSDQAESASVGKGTDAYKWYSGAFTPKGPSEISKWIDDGMKSGVAPVRSANGDGVKMLPPARIHARARRYAVKLFLSHYHSVAWWLEMGTPPPIPYILTRPEHTHVIVPPNIDAVDELQGLDIAIIKHWGL